MNEKIITIQHVIKKYREKVAVNNVSFDVYKGDILGLLGPNGAGKSSTINILSTILPYESGDIKFFGKNMNEYKTEIKQRIGVVPQNLAIFENLTADENVTFFASLYGLRKNKLKDAVEEALQFVGLLDRKHDIVDTFSGGMKRRLNIACAIAHKPEILILDEPTVGIDPQSRNHILDSIRKMHAQGTSIIYTTHYMEEVEALCNRVIIMDHGEKIMDGTINELLHINQQNITYEIEIEIEDDQQVPIAELLANTTILHSSHVDGLLTITATKSNEVLQNILDILSKSNVKICSINEKNQNLESAFLEITGKALRDV